MRYPLEKYQYYIRGDRVIAVSTFAGKTVRGVACCDPSDCFDLDKGKKLAALRCAYKISKKRTARAKEKLAEADEKIAEARAHGEAMFDYYADSLYDQTEAEKELLEYERSLKY